MSVFLFLIILLFSVPCLGQTYSFDGKDKEAIQVHATDSFTLERGYGYDFLQLIEKTRSVQTETYRISPYVIFFSVQVPDGNYRVTVTLGNKKRATYSTIRAEARRLMIERACTQKGKYQSYSFVVNKRDDSIRHSDGKTEYVNIKGKRGSKLNWDEKLTIEVSSDMPVLSSIQIEAVTDVPTLFLCGNSTVVDQECEPWSSWGQMLPRWLDDKIAVANYAESGESAVSFLAERRLQKILSVAHPGDYIFMEFGHNDQKDKRPGAGAFYNFATALKQFVDNARASGLNPVFITPTQRRFFDEAGHIKETHEQYPEAMRWVAKDLNVPVIELHDMTRTFFETLGIEGSKQALVHYPAGTFPGQDKEFADNTHFNPYGAYEIAKMVIEGMKQLNLPFLSHLRSDFNIYSPAQPDSPECIYWPYSPFLDINKPAGN